MLESKTATDGLENSVGGEGTPRESSLLIDVNEVARLLACSARHVWRLADSGRMSRPVKLGALVRWPRKQIEAWIADGCPNCRSTSLRRAANGPKAVRR